MRKRNLIGAALAVAMLAAPAASQASQVMFDAGLPTYKASGGEDNAVSVWLENAGATVRFKDPNVVIWQAGPGCQLLSDHEASCTQQPRVYGVSVQTGSSTDSAELDLAAHKLRVVVDMGSDDDKASVTGTAYTGTLKGGGGMGKDELTDGAGRTTIYGDGVGSSLGGPDVLHAGAGDDSVYGGAGGDTLVGGPGADSLRAQAGADWVDADDGAADAVLGCGPDLDTILVDPLDTPSPDCETQL